METGNSTHQDTLSSFYMSGNVENGDEFTLGDGH